MGEELSRYERVRPWEGSGDCGVKGDFRQEFYRASLVDMGRGCDKGSPEGKGAAGQWGVLPTLASSVSAEREEKGRNCLFGVWDSKHGQMNGKNARASGGTLVVMN